MSSQVRQIGEFRPYWKWSTSFTSAPRDRFDGSVRGQAGQGTQVGGSLRLLDARRRDGGMHVGIVLQPGNDGDELRRLQERQPPRAEVVDERPERLGTQRDARAAAIRQPGVERRALRTSGRRGPGAHRRRLSRHRTCRRSRPPRRGSPRPPAPRNRCRRSRLGLFGVGHELLLTVRTSTADRCGRGRDRRTPRGGWRRSRGPPGRRGRPPRRPTGGRPVRCRR